MKTKVITIICAITLAAVGTTPLQAHAQPDTTVVAADAVVARPLLFAATVVGGAIFVISLPVAATSGSIDSAAHALVVRPARATFVRPLGDFSYSHDNANGSMAAKKGAASKPITSAGARDVAQR
jgi:hypothetical protein